jgi:hypothetical protein
MKYKINSIVDEAKGIVDLSIILDDGTEVRDKMQGLPIGDKDAFEAFVSSYAEAYERGAKATTVIADKALKVNVLTEIGEGLTK